MRIFAASTKGLTTAASMCANQVNVRTPRLERRGIVTAVIESVTCKWKTFA